MRKKIWIRKFHSYSKAGRHDDAYYLSLSPAERLETVQFLREEYVKFQKGTHHESGKGLRRVFKLIEPA